MIMAEVCINGEWQKLVPKTRLPRVKQKPRSGHGAVSRWHRQQDIKKSKDTALGLKKDEYCKQILDYIRKHNKKGAHMSEIYNSLNPKCINRCTVLDRLYRMEDKKIIESRLERSEYGEKQVQKYTRMYRLRGQVPTSE
jgi:hypothetical protein